MDLDIGKLNGFLEVLGYPEEPFGVFYTDTEPGQGFSPKPGDLPNREREAAGEVDWPTMFGNFSCVIGHIWRARKKKTVAYFEPGRFGCMGGAFALGFVKPQCETIIHYVSSGVPGVMEGEDYIESPEALREIFGRLDPRPAPSRFCVFKPLSMFGAGEEPETVIFFARPEILSGLHQLAAFVTNDPEVVASPWGAGCYNITAWPFHYKERGEAKAVLGGWDPSARKYYKTDELTFAVPLEMFRDMLEGWPRSFLAKEVWRLCRKKIARSARAWGE